MTHAGKVVTRSMLLEQVWEFYFDPGTSLVETHISRLRAKIERGFATQLLFTCSVAPGIVCVRPTSFLRTITFRMVLLQAALFALIVAGLFSFVWDEVRTYVEDQSHRSVEVATASLLEAVPDGTLA